MTLVLHKTMVTMYTTCSTMKGLSIPTQCIDVFRTAVRILMYILEYIYIYICIHTHPVGLLWTSDQLAATNTTHDTTNATD